MGENEEGDVDVLDEVEGVHALHGLVVEDLHRSAPLSLGAESQGECETQMAMST